MADVGINPCDRFPYGSRRYQICSGESELSLERANRLRAMFGIEPLEIQTDAKSGDVTVATKAGVVIRRVARQDVPQLVRKGCRSCGGSKRKPKFAGPTPNGSGPGSVLLQMFESAGAPKCDACIALAGKMDVWGVAACQRSIALIVADILPRALEWEAKKLGWLAKLIPTAVTESGIRLLVQQAISTSDRNSPKRPVKRMSPLIGVPINRSKLVTHILYHFMPLAGASEPIWRRHAEWLRSVRNDFNGRMLIGIAAGGKSNKPEHVLQPPEEVKEALSGLDAEFFVVENDKKIGEGKTFPKMLGEIQTRDPDEVFFYGHTKGVTRPGNSLDEPPHLWAEAMFETLFRNRESTISALDTAGCVGPFQMHGGKGLGIPGLGPWWFFSGTFFAARSVDAFRGDWRTLPKYYGCVEQWPRLNFDRKTQTSCLFFDDTNNLYDAEYWQNEVMPAFIKWKEARAK